MTKIYATRDVRCPFSATIELIEHSQRGHRVGPFAGLRTDVECRLAEVRDETDTSRIHEALVLHWKARKRIPVPEMDGLITVRPNGPATELRMEGRYEPPFGIIGRIFDAIIGRRIALQTVNRFLDDLRDFVQAEWQRERQARTGGAG